MNISLNIILPIVISIFFIGVIYFLEEKEFNFSLRVLAGLGLGILLGIIFGKDALIIEPLGKAYVAFIKMLVIPLVMISLIASITNLQDTKQLKTIGIKAISLLLITTGIAAIIGIIIGNVFNVGNGMTFVASEGFKAREIPTFSKVFMDMLPTNPISAMAEGKVIPVTIFALFISVAMLIEEKRNPERIKPIKDLVNGLNTVLIRVTKIILRFTPYGVFALMASVSANNGISTLIPLGTFILAVYIACLIQILGVYTTLIATIGKRNPIKFFKEIYPAQVVAFTTQSSYGALPVTIKSLVENAKIPNSIATFVASMGSTIGMNGCGGIYPAIVSIFVANIFGIELTFAHYVLLVITTIIGSIGIAGVPGAATISTTVVLTSLGLPIEGMAMVLGVDAIIDMIRTMTNVTGSSVVALLVSSTTDNKEEEKIVAA